MELGPRREISPSTLLNAHLILPGPVLFVSKIHLDCSKEKEPYVRIMILCSKMEDLKDTFVKSKVPKIFTER